MKSELFTEFGIIQKILGDKTWIFDTALPSLSDVTVVMLVFFSISIVAVLTTLRHVWDILLLLENEAVQVLKKYTPDDNSDNSNVLPIELGTKVLITPLDTGKKNPASGKLVKSTAQEIVIECKNNDFNTTSYVHFPTLEFTVLPDNSNPQ